MTSPTQPTVSTLFVGGPLSGQRQEVELDSRMRWHPVTEGGVVAYGRRPVADHPDVFAPIGMADSALTDLLGELLAGDR